MALAQAGADVVVAARRRDKLEDTSRKIRALGRAALAVETDVTDPDACRAAGGTSRARRSGSRGVALIRVRGERLELEGEE